MNPLPYSTTLTLSGPAPCQLPGRTGHHSSTLPVTLLKLNCIYPNTSLKLPQYIFCDLHSISAVQLITIAMNAKKPTLLKHISLVGLSLCTGTYLPLTQSFQNPSPLTHLPLRSSLPQHMDTLSITPTLVHSTCLSRTRHF